MPSSTLVGLGGKKLAGLLGSLLARVATAQCLQEPHIVVELNG
jgi:hypothetical protein